MTTGITLNKCFTLKKQTKNRENCNMEEPIFCLANLGLRPTVLFLFLWINQVSVIFYKEHMHSFYHVNISKQSINLLYTLL